MSEIDTFNKFLEGSHADSFVILHPPRVLTADDALLLAAYLVAMAEPTASHPFHQVLEAVKFT